MRDEGPPSPTRSEPDESTGPRGRASRPATITASQSMVGSQAALSGTGFHKPLPPHTKLARIWEAVGLGLGRRLTTVIRDDHIYLILMAAAVGITAGAAAGLLLWWIEYAVALFPETGGDTSAWLRWAVVIAIPAIGGLGAGLVRSGLQRLFPTGLISGVPSLIEAIAQRRGVIKARSGAACGIGTGLTIGTGGSCGHEGPSVAIGAAVGSALSRFFGLRARRHMAMVGAGSAAGLAAAFNAPLAGVIFTVELVFGGSIGGNVGTMSVFIPLIVAAVSGTFVSHAIHGEKIGFVMHGHQGVDIPDLGFYVLLAVIAGLIGSAMARINIATERRFSAMTIPSWLKPGIGALGVGVLAAVFSNDILGAGHAMVETALRGELLWQTALLLLVLKIFASALTVGSGGFGGFFLPSLYVGACLGTVVGTVAEVVIGPGAQPVGAYALVGMGAIFAALMHAPLTPIVMLFELTHDWGIILPLMLGCILAVVVGKRVNELSYYRLVLRHRGVVLESEAETEVMRRGTVKELMIPADVVLTEGADLEEVRRVVLGADLRAIFVVDEAARVVGFVNGNTLAKRMLGAEIQPDSTAGDLMGRADLTLLYPGDTLAGAMLAFARSGQELLPVVDTERRLLGVIRRGDLLAHYSDKVLGAKQEVLQVHSAEGKPDQEVGLGKGLILERIVVGRNWAGRSLTELELRRKAGVTVLEWSRAHDVLEVNPRKPLREGDILAVCGTREQILRTRTLW